jgi:hypothetical protein
MSDRKETRFTVTPNWKRDPVVYEIHEYDGEYKLLCYTVRRNKADRICKALNKLERRYNHNDSN